MSKFKIDIVVIVFDRNNVARKPIVLRKNGTTVSQKKHMEASTLT